MAYAGLTSVIAKFSMQDMSSDSALAVRTTVVFIFVIAIDLLFWNAFTGVRKAAPRELILLALSGMNGSVLWIFYYRAMNRGPVSCVDAIDKASIVVTSALSFLILREPVTAKVRAGARLIPVGMPM